MKANQESPEVEGMKMEPDLAGLKESLSESVVSLDLEVGTPQMANPNKVGSAELARVPGEPDRQSEPCRVRRTCAAMKWVHP